jgi:hypothetical protein
MTDCPFMNPARTRDACAAIYCRLPGGRVRMPTREETERYCRRGRWDVCPTSVTARRRVEAHRSALAPGNEPGSPEK